jgi:hypothetical protein
VITNYGRLLSNFLLTHSPEEAQAGFLASPEFYQNRGQGTAAGFLDAVYQELLGRHAELTALKALAGVGSQVVQDPLFRYQLVMAIEQSPEAESDRIRSDYNNYLFRSPEPAAVQSWLAAAANGLTENDLFALIAVSPEYAKPRSGGTINDPVESE